MSDTLSENYTKLNKKYQELREIHKSSTEQIERLKYKLGLITSDNQDLNRKVKELEEDLFGKDKIIAVLEDEQIGEMQEHQEVMKLADARIKELEEDLLIERNLVSFQKEKMFELEKENKDLHTALNKGITEQIAMRDYIKKITTIQDENVTKLQTQLHELPKKICEEIRCAFYCEFDEILPSIMSDKIDEIQKKYEV